MCITADAMRGGGGILIETIPSVRPKTCHKAWIGTDEADANRIAEQHLADRTQPSATTRKEAPRAS